MMKELNEEMEQMLTEDHELTSTRGKQRAEKPAKKVSKFTDASPSYLASLVPTEVLLKDQIEAALLAETLIDEIRTMES